MENNEEIRSVLYTDEFDLFYSELDDRTKEKYRQGIEILKTVYVLSTKIVKKIVNTDLYELRISVGYNEYRSLFFCADHENVIQATQIILLNGFLKKSPKDYDKQIKRAIKILKEIEL
jgi:hypothetical protein